MEIYNPKDKEKPEYFFKLEEGYVNDYILTLVDRKSKWKANLLIINKISGKVNFAKKINSDFGFDLDDEGRLKHE